MSDEKEVSISTINQRLSSAFDAGNAVQFSIAAADAVVYAETLEQINERLHDRNKSQEARIKEIELELLSLRALRDAGDATDGEIEGDFGKVQVWIGRRALDSTEKYHESLAAESLDKIRSEFIARGQQLREARSEIERLKGESDIKVEIYRQQIRSKLVAQRDELLKQAGFDPGSSGGDASVKTIVMTQEEYDTLTAERDEARKEAERLTGCLKKANDGYEEHERLWYLEQNKTEALTAELAALKAAPGMEEVDALESEIERGILESDGAIEPLGKLADLARRSIAAHAEVVGLMRWLDEFSDFDEVRNSLLEYASSTDYGEDQHRAMHTLNILNGKAWG